MASNPGGVAGALFDPTASNALGGMCSGIGFGTNTVYGPPLTAGMDDGEKVLVPVIGSPVANYPAAQACGYAGAPVAFDVAASAIAPGGYLPDGNVNLTGKTIPAGAGVLASWTTSLLYGSSEQGGWYDPSDLSAQFQDSLGITPVTAAGQPVGLVLDKRLGLARGPELTGVNFGSSTGWSFGVTGTITPAGIAGGALVLPRTDASNLAFGGYTVATTIGKTYELVVTAGSGGTVQARAGGSLNNASAGAVNVTARATQIIKFVATANPQYISFNPQTDGAAATVVASSVRLLDGNHLVQGTAASRPTLQQDASGFWHWAFDGVNDYLSVAAMNLSGTDKVSIFCGVFKPVDTGSPTVYEHTVAADANAGGFYLRAPNGGVSNLNALMRGATGNNSVTPANTAPDSMVLAALHDLAAPRTDLRRNGVLLAGNTAATGGGNFASAAFYVGERAGTTGPFSGRIYQLIVRGASSTAAEIAAAERFVGSKMGITL